MIKHELLRQLILEHFQEKTSACFNYQFIEAIAEQMRKQQLFPREYQEEKFLPGDEMKKPLTQHYRAKTHTRVLYKDEEWQIVANPQGIYSSYLIEHFHPTHHHSGFSDWVSSEGICVECKLSIPQKIRTLLELLL